MPATGAGRRVVPGTCSLPAGGLQACAGARWSRPSSRRPPSTGGRGSDGWSRTVYASWPHACPRCALFSPQLETSAGRGGNRTWTCRRCRRRPGRRRRPTRDQREHDDGGGDGGAEETVHHGVLLETAPGVGFVIKPGQHAGYRRPAKAVSAPVSVALTAAPRAPTLERCAGCGYLVRSRSTARSRFSGPVTGSSSRHSPCARVSGSTPRRWPRRCGASSRRRRPPRSCRAA